MADDTIIDLYAEYWLTHIKPIQDDRRSAYFTNFLLDFMHRRYGYYASLTLGFRLLQIETTPIEPSGNRVSDSE